VAKDTRRSNVVTFSVVFEGVYNSDDVVATAVPGVKRVRADISGAPSLRCFRIMLCICDKVLILLVVSPALAGAFATDGRKMFVVEVVAAVEVLPKFRGQSTL